MNLELNGRAVTADLQGIDRTDFPRFTDAFLGDAVWADTGEELTASEEDQLNLKYQDSLSDMAFESLIDF
jgi:hypothetical protein